MLAKSSRLPSQIEFSSLSDPHQQPESCQQDAMDHDAFSRSGSSSSAKAVKSAGMERDPYVPVNFISPETCARLAAAEESAARCADAMDASVNLEYTYRVSSARSAVDGCRDPLRTLTSMAPPKRFYRTFWKSISFRLLHRWTQEAKSSCAPKVA